MKSFHGFFPKIIGLALLGLIIAYPVPGLSQPAGQAKARPALYEFGAGYCVSCKEMAKIMAELQASRGDQVEVRMIYADKEKDLFQRYKIMLIPTQVFLDARGQEVDRHVGALSKDEVLQKLRELKFIHE